MTNFERAKLKVLLKASRARHLEAADATEKVYEEIDKIAKNKTVNLDRPTGAENASTVEEAINCYVAYGEYDADSLIAEIETAIKDAE